MVCAAIINKASKAPEGEEFETSSKNTCILITHQLFMRKPSPLGSNFQGPCLLGCCLGAAQKPFPAIQSCPAEPLPPALCQDRCRHRDSTSSYPGTGSPSTAPQCSRWQQPYLSAARLCCQKPPVEPGSRGEESGSAAAAQRYAPAVVNRQVSSERSRLLSLQFPSTGAWWQRAW